MKDAEFPASEKFDFFSGEVNKATDFGLYGVYPQVYWIFKSDVK
jgi:hypothetical protein